MKSVDVINRWSKQELTIHDIRVYLAAQAAHEVFNLDDVTFAHVTNLCYQMYKAHIGGYPNGDAMEAFKEGDLRKFMRHADQWTLKGIKLLEIFWINIASKL